MNMKNVLSIDEHIRRQIKRRENWDASSALESKRESAKWKEMKAVKSYQSRNVQLEILYLSYFWMCQNIFRPIRIPNDEEHESLLS